MPPVAFVGALRLAKPGSPWARRQYADNPAKLERAQRRDEGFHQKWERRKHRLWDLIGGKPHLALPHREGHRDRHLTLPHRDRHRDRHDRGPHGGPPGDSRESHV